MTKFPLKDGDTYQRPGHCGTETVAGEIKPPHDEPICWTIQGNWYRRSDGEPMTGAAGEVMTEKKFYRLRREGKL